MSDDALTEFAAALRSSDADRIARLEPEARGRLARFCRGYLGDFDAAEDAVQEVWMRLSALAAPPLVPRTWILAVARNHCLDVLRARAAGPGSERMHTEFDAVRETAGPITRLVGAERESDLAAALGLLSSGERELLRLRYAEDLSRAEVAELVGASEDLVKSRLYEAVEKLRRGLRAHP